LRLQLLGAQISVSEAYLGRVINALAKPIDGRGGEGEHGGGGGTRCSPKPNKAM
jgi:flagellar biosynthesis/type III secretory pathway ATPase